MPAPEPSTALRPMVFCVMPYGERTHPDSGLRYDFDALYTDVVAPGAADAGCDVLRSDYEITGGLVHTSMFERLLLAEVVVADLSLPNPNVYYELGVRHAARPRSTVVMGCFEKTTPPFDVAPLRHLAYRLDGGGVVVDGPALRHALAERIRRGLSERAQVDSPIFSLVANYPGIELSHEAAESYRDRVTGVITWRAQLAQAVATHDREAVGALVAAHGGIPELVMDAVLAYRDLEDFDAMIDQLDSDPHLATSASGIELAAFARNRRNGPGDRAAAMALLEALADRDGMTSERGALIGRVYKDAWLEARDSGSVEAFALLENAIQAYRRGLEADPRDPLPGVNLTTLLALSGRDGEVAQVSPVVSFALARRGGLHSRDYFDVASLCELSCVVGDSTLARQAATFARGRPHPRWARKSTARNLRLLGEVRPLADELATWFD